MSTLLKIAWRNVWRGRRRTFLIAGAMGFFVLFIAPIVGTIIVEVARTITRRRRSQRLFQVVAAGALIGGLPWIIKDLLFGFVSFGLISNFGGLGFVLLIRLTNCMVPEISGGSLLALGI